MLDFPCKCGEPFSLPDELAGTTMQCPACHRLVDVPTAGELAVMDVDGTYQFDPEGPAGDDVRYADLHRFFTRKTVNADGSERDLRRPIEEYDLVDSEPVKNAPRYDPETGELIRPLAVVEAATPVIALDEDGNEPLVAIPLPPMKSLGYAVGDTARRRTIWTMVRDAFGPGNVAVMIVVFFTFIAARMTVAVVETYTGAFFSRPWPFLIVNLPMWLIVSHLAVVIEETGPGAADDLPRPLRNLELGEDIFGPLFKVMLSLAICFVPAFVGLLVLDLTVPAAAVVETGLFVMGCIPFPAVLLTAVTGSTLLNLRPDRVLGVIGRCGGAYLTAVAAGALCVAATTFYAAFDVIAPYADRVPAVKLLRIPPIMFAGLVVATTALHVFGQYLGQLYRQHHDDFPWLAQRHVKTPRPVSLRATTGKPVPSGPGRRTVPKHNPV